MEERRTDSTTG